MSILASGGCGSRKWMPFRYFCALAMWKFSSEKSEGGFGKLWTYVRYEARTTKRKRRTPAPLARVLEDGENMGGRINGKWKMENGKWKVDGKWETPWPMSALFSFSIFHFPFTISSCP